MRDLVDPVLEHVEDAELDGLAVLLPEPLQVLGGGGGVRGIVLYG